MRICFTKANNYRHGVILSIAKNLVRKYRAYRILSYAQNDKV
jgi:hypothetical protein